MSAKKTLGIFICLLLVGFFLRSFQGVERYMYAHDADLYSWIIRDIMVDKHIRLIGQLTSAPGIFIGPYFYYLLIPFYLIGNFDPVTVIGLGWIVGFIAISSIFYVVSKIHGTKTALIASVIYATSFLIVGYEREVVPTMFIPLWTIWFYYFVHRLNKEPKYVIPLGILFGFVWHVQLALAVLGLICLVLVAKHLKVARTWIYLILALVCFIVVSIPLIGFEVRHNFSQTNSLLFTFGEHPTIYRTPIEKVVQVVTYMSKNANNIFWQKPEWVNIFALPLILLTGFVSLLIYKKVRPLTVGIVTLWLTSFLLFFAFHPINLSEYYLYGVNVLWIIMAALLLKNALNVNNQIIKQIVLAFIVLLCAGNSIMFVTSRINPIGYNQKKHLIAQIKADALKHKYPCVAISYMTERGYELGYRYFIWRDQLRTAPPSSLAPVYTVVYPQSKADRLDISFGAIGLIYPEYERYTPESVKISCSGENSNETDSMFGFTK